MRRRVTTTMLLTCSPVLLGAPVCLAQQAPQGAGGDIQSASQDAGPGAVQGAIQEVLVTARKKSRAERAQDVPISMSVLGGEQIEAMLAKDLSDVGRSMPNVKLDPLGSFPGVANYAIRGMGFNSSIASVEPTVGVFVDGVYLGVNLGGSPYTLDLEAVEVLRGPQGTLFGRNVTGGAVVMRSRRPTGEFGALTRVGIGSGERKSIAATLEGSLTDTLAGKIFAQYSERDGDFNNTFLGTKHGAEDTSFVRPMLRWRPRPGVDVTAILEHGEVDGDGTIARNFDDPNTLLTQDGVQAPQGVRNLSLNHPGWLDIEWTQGVIDASWDVGSGSLVSITGYRDGSYASSGDTDGTGINVAIGNNWTDYHQFSEEIRYAGLALGDRLDYTVGVYYLEQEIEQFYHVLIYGNSSQRSHGILDHRTASVFFQGDYEIVPGWFLTGGLRYTWEEKDILSAKSDDCDADLNCTFSFSGSNSWDNVTPKIGLTWKASDDTLVFASWTKGFRSGGYNIRTVAVNETPGPYDEEIVKAYEVGVKTSLFDDRARLSLSAFHNKYDDLQRTVVDFLTLANRIDNAASATIKGVELEAQLLPLDDLAIRASTGYLDATYDSYDLLDVDLDGTPDPELAKGLHLVRAPEWTYALSVTHEASLGAAGRLVSTVAYDYRDKTTMTDANSHWLDGYGLVNASLKWSPPGASGLEVSIWGKNLTNELYGDTGSPTTLFLTVYQGLPRTYGLQVDYRL